MATYTTITYEEGDDGVAVPSCLVDVRLRQELAAHAARGPVRAPGLVVVVVGVHAAEAQAGMAFPGAREVVVVERHTHDRVARVRGVGADE